MTNLELLPIEKLPKIEPGKQTDPALVVVHEFGCRPVYAIARASQSSLPGQEVAWYLDREFYNMLDYPYMEVSPVTHFAFLPPPENYV